MGADLRGTEPWVQELGRWVEHGRQAGTNSLKGGGTGDRAMNVRIKPPSTTRQQQARKWEEPTAFYPFLIFNSKKIPSVQVCKRKSILLWQIPCCAIFLYFFACARSSWLEKIVNIWWRYGSTKLYFAPWWHTVTPNLLYDISQEHLGLDNIRLLFSIPKGGAGGPGAAGLSAHRSVSH
jgi:hypothetical protein